MASTPTYNVKAINSLIPIKDMIEYLGCSTNKANNGNISCPSINHDDKKPSAHIYEQSNVCKCFSCNKSFTPLSLYREHKGLEDRMDYPTACAEVIEIFNLPKDMVIDNYMDTLEDVSPKNKFPLMREELELIGLRPVPNSVKQQINVNIKEHEEFYPNPNYVYTDEFIRKNELKKQFGGKYEEEGKTVVEQEEFPVYKKREFVQNGSLKKTNDNIVFSMENLFKEDKEAFSYLIFSKATETYEANKNDDELVDKLSKIVEKVEKNTGFKLSDFQNDIKIEEIENDDYELEV